MNIKPQPNAFGLLLKRLRTARKLTQEQLAKRAGISAVHISEMERRKGLPSAGTVRALAEALTASEETLTVAVIESWAWNFQSAVGEWE